MSNSNSFHFPCLIMSNVKFNSTETTLFTLHDHIIRAISQQVTGLCLYLISRPPSILLIIPSSYNASNHGSESTTLFYPGFNHISPLDPSLSTSTTSNLLLFSLYMAFLKALSFVLFSPFFTQFHLATSFLSHQSITSSIYYYFILFYFFITYM